MTQPVLKPSVLLIGAGGAFGVPLVEEFIRQKSKFARIGALASPEKVGKFEHLKEHGIEVIVGSFLDKNVYDGAYLFFHRADLGLIHLSSQYE
jgi:hypothetical protein